MVEADVNLRKVVEVVVSAWVDFFVAHFANSLIVRRNSFGASAISGFYAGLPLIQRLQFGSAFLSYSWEWKFALFFNFPISRVRPKKLCDFYWLQLRIAHATKTILRQQIYIILRRGTKAEVSVWHWHWIIGSLFWFVLKMCVWTWIAAQSVI